jgi:NitT/TauT family transport system permease protein
MPSPDSHTPHTQTTEMTYPGRPAAPAPSARAPAASAPAAIPPRRVSILRRAAPFSALSILLLLAAWLVGTQVADFVPPQYLPSPSALIAQFVELVRTGYAGTPLWEDVLASFLRMAAGFLLSVAVAVPLGICMGMSPPVRGFFTPIFNSLRPIPSIGLIPLMVLWFGIGQSSKIAVIFLASFLFVVLNTTEGVRTVPDGLIRAAQNLGAGRFQLFWRVILPAALPAIFTGLKTGLAVSWAVVVAAELLGAQRGLGFMIEDAATFYRINVVYVGLVLIGIFGLLMVTSINWLERRYIHWTGKS